MNVILRIDLFTNVYASINLPFDWKDGLDNLLSTLNLTIQGAMLILLLVVIGIFAWKGSEKILDGDTGGRMLPSPLSHSTLPDKTQSR